MVANVEVNRVTFEELTILRIVFEAAGCISREPFDTQYAVMYGALAPLHATSRGPCVLGRPASRTLVDYIPFSLDVPECHGVSVIREEATSECMNIVALEGAAYMMTLCIFWVQVGFFIGVFLQDDVVVNDSSIDRCMDSVLVLEVPSRATFRFV
jgi:hypothetical protein